MLERSPSTEEMANLVGERLYGIWIALTELIDSKYDMERLWNSGGKEWQYEYKYRRGGKTLCANYAKENRIGLMLVFGKYERKNIQ